MFAGGVRQARWMSPRHVPRPHEAVWRTVSCRHGRKKSEGVPFFLTHPYYGNLWAGVNVFGLFGPDGLPLSYLDFFAVNDVYARHDMGTGDLAVCCIDNGWFA